MEPLLERLAVDTRFLAVNAGFIQAEYRIRQLPPGDVRRQLYRDMMNGIIAEAVLVLYLMPDHGDDFKTRFIHRASLMVQQILVMVRHAGNEN